MVENLNNGDKIKLDILGKSFDLEVIIQRAFWGDDSKESIPLNEKELDELNWLKNSGILNTLEKALLDYCNKNYEAIGAPGITSIYPEINFEQVYILNDGKLALLGECNSDFEHGISVKFNNREFIGVGQNSDWF